MLTQDDTLRDRPTQDFIAQLTRQYPVEREIEKSLARKMERRNQGQFSRPSLETLSGYLSNFLADKLDGTFEVSHVRWLNGGASKLQVAFDLAWTEGAGKPRKEALVLRMEPAEALNSNSRLREYELLQAFKGVVPVPDVYFLDEHGDWFPEPALIYSFANGVTKPPATHSGKIAGMGTDFGPELRAQLAPQFLGYLAKIHTFDHTQYDFKSMDAPRVDSTESAVLQLNRAHRVWEEDAGDSAPLMAVAANWLERNLPKLDKVSVVHGDYRSGNFLYDPVSFQFTAWLDWERGYLGDRHRDLAWTTQRMFGHLDTDGKTYMVCGLVPMNTFYREYEAVSGLSVNEDTLHYYRVLNAYQLVATLLATSYRVTRLGRSHQDVLLARLRAMVPSNLNTLATLLKERL
ncbi:phosphotransferase family protein [Hydrogenophaga sp. BPS33]|uniref:phosphotransferase family protein n=1 Tax=Hydrogenophaga sp. BPS33 TaxID=2651974 RepID=UPI0019172DB6|nr:phosphotransferase family protein [Hydrogenophaga sp. BPS33]